ncbi:FKBP-type peptidyl-prolyl cis-trans isomerase [Algibacter mikhailovii]|uniref:Peptidyl-prolyl cis-trans isomerase n=1 Tax=Algibacter mikhailovii TaxID=425498 RepID=A0A918V762_9FLAO|nr:peptidylprolyl isomerase [Algibacter mikhailovii]GGZ77834.1 peptidyl-prolyl cis-trans isomerase [Algibacter mikhailovii]
MSLVKENDTVKVHYTGTLSNGQVFDSSLEREPLEITLGQGLLIPGFEKGLVDMAVNQKKTINIPVDEAYGEINNELFYNVGKDQLPPEMTPEVGMALASKGPDGKEVQFRVAEVNDDHIVVDANHPLAGQALTFELELIDIA